MLLLLLSGRTEAGQEGCGGSGEGAPDLPNMEIFVFLFSPFRTPRGLKDRKDLDNYVDCHRKRGPRTSGCAGLVHPRRLPCCSVKRGERVQTEGCHKTREKSEAVGS